MFVVHNGEDGPLGLMELKVADGTEVCDGYCGRNIGRGEIVGWFDDGYQSRIAFCSEHCIGFESEIVATHVFATEAEAKAYERDWRPT